MDVVRSAPQGAHYHADVIYLLPYLGIKKGASALLVLRFKPTPTRFPTNSLNTPMDNTFLHLKHICLFYEETPSHGPIPPIVRMARWPKTPGELERYIGAESVRTIRQGRELCCVMRTAGEFIECVDKIEDKTSWEKLQMFDKIK